MLSDGEADERSITKWAGLVGRWMFDGNQVTYQGPGRGPEIPEVPFGVCVSNIRFLEGEARVTVQHREAGGSIDGRLLFGYQSLNSSYYTVGLGGWGRAYTLSRFNPASGWEMIAGTGARSNLERPQYPLLVRVRGQQVSLEVDDVRVFEHVIPTPLPYGQLGLFAWGEERIEFTDFSVKFARDSRGDAFVVMQFAGFEELYSDVIEPLTKKFHLRPYRADKIFGPGSIVEDIVQSIKTAQIIIAEITPVNANVFYEVGYAHAMNKPTILLAEEGTKLPFDLSGYRCIFYKNSIGGKRVVEEKLDQHLQAILDI